LAKSEINLPETAKFTSSTRLNSEPTFLHQLATKTYFDYIFTGAFGQITDALRKKVVDLSIEHHVLSRLTAIVAVQERTGATTEAMEIIRVPLPKPIQSVVSQGGRFMSHYKATIGADFECSALHTNNARLNLQVRIP